jgi:hypothetical protein
MFHFSFHGVRSFLRKTLKNVNAPFRLIILNEETQEEALRFQLTKKSVYIFFSSVFVGLFLLFSFLIFFTPLKYYVPGTSQSISRNEMIKIQRLSDSLVKMNKAQEKFIANMLAVAKGDETVLRDTARLSQAAMQQAASEVINKVDNASNYNQLRNQKPVAKDSVSK